MTEITAAERLSRCRCR